MNLREFLENNDIDKKLFADRLGVTSAEIYQWTSGRRRPSLERMALIEEITFGCVPCKSWVTSDIETPAKKHKEAKPKK